jgi:hypothetical protein
MHVSINKQVDRKFSKLLRRSISALLGGGGGGQANDVFSFPKSKRAKIQYVVGHMVPASQDVG